MLVPLADPVLEEEYKFLVGDISHHLSFSYLKCGKLLYAVEECSLAIKKYEELQSRYISLQKVKNNLLQELEKSTRAWYPNESSGQRGLPGVIFRLRHAWGLMAVIRCQRREQTLSTEALAKVQQLQPGPVVEKGNTLYCIIICMYVALIDY